MGNDHGVIDADADQFLASDSDDDGINNIIGQLNQHYASSGDSTEDDVLSISSGEVDVTRTDRNAPLVPVTIINESNNNDDNVNSNSNNRNNGSTKPKKKRKKKTNKNKEKTRLIKKRKERREARMTPRDSDGDTVSSKEDLHIKSSNITNNRKRRPSLFGVEFDY